MLFSIFLAYNIFTVALVCSNINHTVWKFTIKSNPLVTTSRTVDRVICGAQWAYFPKSKLNIYYII